MTPPTPHPAEALILARVPETLRERLARVRLMVFDVDGVLTDGGLWYDEHGETVKRFNALDGHGMRLLGASGVALALMTGRDSALVRRRAADLGISEVHQGVRDKATALTELTQRLNIPLEHTGFMGDDVLDLPAMRLSGLAASVPDAPFYVSQGAHWVSQRAGGQGAVRELCDLILAAQGRLGALIAAGGGALPLAGTLQ